MLILAVDTSTSRGSLALTEGSTLLAEKSWQREKSHSENITICLEELFQTAKKNLGDIEAIALGKGPGSFTGVRIALNLAKTLSYSLNIPIFTYDTLTIIAEDARDYRGFILAGINAFKNQVYYSYFDNRQGELQCIKGPEAQSLEKLESLVNQKSLYLGDGIDVYGSSLSKNFAQQLLRRKTFSDYPRATNLAQMAQRDLGNSKALAWNEVYPLYLRCSEAEEKLKAGLLEPLDLTSQ